MFKKIHVFRVMPGEELVTEVNGYCRKNGITSGIIIGIIGSATRARLNFLHDLPGKYSPEDYTGPLEIVAAQGSIATLNGETVPHIHIQLGDKDACHGGHLVEASIFTTAEVVIGELDYQLKRQFDSYTGLNELIKG